MGFGDGGLTAEQMSAKFGCDVSKLDFISPGEYLTTGGKPVDLNDLENIGFLACEWFLAREAYEDRPEIHGSSFIEAIRNLQGHALKKSEPD